MPDQIKSRSSEWSLFSFAVFSLAVHGSQLAAQHTCHLPQLALGKQLDRLAVLVLRLQFQALLSICYRSGEQRLPGVAVVEQVLHVTAEGKDVLV